MIVKGWTGARAFKDEHDEDQKLVKQLRIMRIVDHSIMRGQTSGYTLDMRKYRGFRLSTLRCKFPHDKHSIAESEETERAESTYHRRTQMILKKGRSRERKMKITDSSLRHLPNRTPQTGSKPSLLLSRYYVPQSSSGIHAVTRGNIHRERVANSARNLACGGIKTWKMGYDDNSLT